jgi:Putative component of 'biosynthetic module'
MKRGFEIQLIESMNPLVDILIPAKSRQGYKEGESPVVPIFFYRYVGIAGLDSMSQDNYYNQLFNLHDTLQKNPAGYVKIESPIAMPNNEEIQRAVDQVKKGNPNSSKSYKDMIVSQVVRSGALSVFQSPVINLNVPHAFEQVMDLYMKTERNVNESKAENFALKLLVWLKRYQAHFFKEAILNDVPKVMFYGDIKQHEVYFLTFLSLIGCDVLVFNTDKEKDFIFEQVDRYHQFTKKVEFAESCSLEIFPISERAIQKTTVAYNASKEIHSALYGADVGLFKAWQYETGTTKPVMLKTTYDELKILWNEEAKIRPEFEVKNDRVYVPNIFAKVNGTKEDISEYWKEVHGLASAENTVLYKNLPFSTVRYTKQEMFSTAFLFNKQGFVDKETLYQHPVYRLQYLKGTIQDFIVSKINELLDSKMFVKEMDEKLRLKVLMTIITMDSELLRLIESFDYTGKIPKIVIYDGTRNLFSEEDSILLAFFNLVGADIVIFTPTNYTNIEQWIKPNYLAIHQLPSVQFDMDFQEKALSIKGRTNSNGKPVSTKLIVIVGAVISIGVPVLQFFL